MKKIAEVASGSSVWMSFRNKTNNHNFPAIQNRLNTVSNAAESLNFSREEDAAAEAGKDSIANEDKKTLSDVGDQCLLNSFGNEKSDLQSLRLSSRRGKRRAEEREINSPGKRVYHEHDAFLMGKNHFSHKALKELTSKSERIQEKVLKYARELSEIFNYNDCKIKAVELEDEQLEFILTNRKKLKFLFFRNENNILTTAKLDKPERDFIIEKSHLLKGLFKNERCIIDLATRPETAKHFFFHHGGILKNIFNEKTILEISEYSEKQQGFFLQNRNALRLVFKYDNYILQVVKMPEAKQKFFLDNSNILRIIFQDEDNIFKIIEMRQSDQAFFLQNRDELKRVFQREDNILKAIQMPDPARNFMLQNLASLGIIFHDEDYILTISKMSETAQAFFLQNRDNLETFFRDEKNILALSEMPKPAQTFFLQNRNSLKTVFRDEDNILCILDNSESGWNFFLQNHLILKKSFQDEDNILTITLMPPPAQAFFLKHCNLLKIIFQEDCNILKILAMSPRSQAFFLRNSTILWDFFRDKKNILKISAMQPYDQVFFLKNGELLKNSFQREEYILRLSGMTNSAKTFFLKYHNILKMHLSEFCIIETLLLPEPSRQFVVQNIQYLLKVIDDEYYIIKVAEMRPEQKNMFLQYGDKMAGILKGEGIVDMLMLPEESMATFITCREQLRNIFTLADDFMPERINNYNKNLSLPLLNEFKSKGVIVFLNALKREQDFILRHGENFYNLKELCDVASMTDKIRESYVANVDWIRKNSFSVFDLMQMLTLEEDKLTRIVAMLDSIDKKHHQQADFHSLAGRLSDLSLSSLQSIAALFHNTAKTPSDLVQIIRLQLNRDVRKNATVST